MDDLILQIIKDLGINNQFSRNNKTYQILKENIKNKLKDIYADDILNEYTADKILFEEEHGNKIPLYKREKNENIDKILTKVEIHMINFFNRKKQKEEEWEEVLQKLKSDDGLWGKKNKINIANNKVLLSYDYPWQKGGVLMCLYTGTGKIIITTIEEIKMPKKKNKLEDDYNRYKKREIFDKYGNALITTVKEYGKHRNPNLIKHEVDNLKKQYFDDIFEKIKKLKKLKDNNIIATLLLSIAPNGEEKIQKEECQLIK